MVELSGKEKKKKKRFSIVNGIPKFSIIYLLSLR